MSEPTISTDYTILRLHAQLDALKTRPISPVCIHGSLRRSCETCDLAERLDQAERERDEALGLLRECRPWVSRGLMDHPAPTTDDWAVLARLDALLGGRDE